MADATLPTDLYSRRRRELTDNPGALQAGSQVSLKDFYGNFQAWIVETFRVDGQETIFLIVSDAEGGRRFMLPPEVTTVLYRQYDQLIARARRRGARQAVETKRAKGQTIGNPDAFKHKRKRAAK